MNIISLHIPQDNQKLALLRAGDIIALSGTIYTARDAAHKRICDSINNNTPLPFDINGAAIYYTGPTPTKKGEIIGSCGPTSSTRMDDYTPLLLEHCLKIMIGKGIRAQFVIDSMVKNSAVYLCAVGGAAALMKKYITSNELIAYEDLGTEAVRKLTVKDMPLIVAIDSQGNKIFNI